MKLKTCSKCKVEKPVSEFYSDKVVKDGYRSQCKECAKAYYRNNNEKYKKYREENLEKIKAQQKRTYEKHKKERYKKKKKYRSENKEKVLEQDRKYREKNKSHISNKKREYNKKNKSKINEARREKRASNINYRIGIDLRVRIIRAVKSQGTIKSEKTESLLGCSIEEVISHLEKQFKPGMTWENHGLYGWHIDHKRPCAAFNLSDPNEQRKCFHYSNLQPLWAEENLKKSDTIIEEAQ